MKLTLRELFLLVVIAAMDCGWWVERHKCIEGRQREELWRARADQLAGEMKSAGFRVELETRNSPSFTVEWPAALLPRFWRDEEFVVPATASVP